MFTADKTHATMETQMGLRIMELSPINVRSSRRTRGALIQIMAIRASTQPRKESATVASPSIWDRIVALFTTSRPHLLNG